jgi:hypothetical protein
MSFSEIADFRTELGRLTKEYPKLLRAGEVTLLWTIISYPDGCFIGEQELADQAHLSLSTKDTYLRKLTKLGFITREQSYARKGVRQCYRVSVKDMRNYRLSPVIANTNSLPPITDKPMPITDKPNAYHRSHAYRDYKDYKYDINQERFNKVLNAIPKDFRSYINAGTNYEMRLNKLEHRGTTLEAVCAYLTKQNWTQAGSKGGLLSHFLDVLLSDTKASKSSPMKWCGECDEATRTYDIPERDEEGRTYYECGTCSPEGIRRKNLKKVTLDEKTDVLKTLGFPFGRSVDE